MKSYSIIFVSVLFLGLKSRGQDEPAYLNKSWKDLVAQIQRRNDAATVLLIQLKETNRFDSKALQKTKRIVKDFTVYLSEQRTKFDSNTVRQVYEMNRAVSSNMGRTLILLENLPRIRQMSEITILLQHLDGTEKRLQTFRKQHNGLAAKYGRLHLAFNEN